MTSKKTRIETETAPPSTGFRSQGLIAGDVLFTGGQIGAAMPEPGVLPEPSTDMAEAVQLTLGHLEQVTLAAGLDRAAVFEVSAFPKELGQRDLILQEIESFLDREPALFNFHEVEDVAAHALLEMDWMATASADISLQAAADMLRPLGSGPSGERIESGPFLIWNGIKGYGADLAEATENLLDGIQQRLQAAGGSLEDLVKLTVYIYAYDPYPQFNEATKRRFAGIIPPTRSVLVAPEVTGDAKICMDILALRA